MRKTILITICIAALFINAYYGYFGWRESVNTDLREGDVRDDGGGEENGQGNGGPDGDGPAPSEFLRVELELFKKSFVEIENDTREITVIDIVGEAATLIFGSDPEEITVRKGETKKVLTDGSYYLILTVVDIVGETVTLEIRSYEKFSVRMPPKKIGDEYTYDFEMYVELYRKNYSTGEHTKYTMRSDGSWVTMVDGPWEVETGYGDEHESILDRYILNGEFEIYVDSPETGEVVVNGRFSADDKEYTELIDRKTIRSEKSGEINVNQLPGAKFGPPVSYKGDMRYYPDPGEDQPPTISDRIYGGKNGGRTVREGDSGQVFFEGSSEQASGVYNWTAERKEVVAVDGGDKEALLLNITSHNDEMTSHLSEGFINSSVYYVFDFHRHAWITNEDPYAIKEIFRTNSSYENEKEISWFVFEERRKLLTCNPGEEDIPWKDDGNADHPSEHPLGEYERWGMVPKGGHMFDEEEDPEDLKVQMAPEGAFEFGSENNEGLNDFLADHPDAFVSWAKYNTSLLTPQLNDKLGSHRWNFSLEEYMSDDEAKRWKRKEGQWPQRHYQFRVAKNVSVNKNPLDPAPYDYTTEIDADLGREKGWSNVRRDGLSDTGCTLSGAHDIIRADPDGSEELFDSDGELILEDLSVHIGKVAGPEEAPGAEITEALTGLDMPYSKYTWSFQRGSLKKTGNTFIISVDVETGRLVQMTRLKGSAVLGIFE